MYYLLASIPVLYVVYNVSSPNVKDRNYNVITLLLVLCILLLIPGAALPRGLAYLITFPPAFFGVVVGPLYSRIAAHVLPS